MEKEDFIELSIKFICCETTIQEEKLLKELFKEKEYFELFQSIKTEMNNSDTDYFEPNFRKDEGFLNLSSKIRETEPDFLVKQNSRLNVAFSPAIYKVAASVIIFLFLSSTILYFYKVYNQYQKSVQWSDKVTVMGQKSIFRLSDGTKITLNAGSRFKYPNKFGESVREVYLEGEAYFEVAHNEGKPFIVHTGRILTKVLGTKFNVKAFPDEKEIAVSLVDGKVNVFTAEESSVLAPGQQLIFYKNSGDESISHFDFLHVVGWKENILIFDNIEIGKVFVQLEREFGTKFDLEDKTVANLRIKANFENESLWTVVEVIKKATNLNYRVETKNGELEKIIFIKK